MAKPRKCRKWDCPLPASFADKRPGWYCDRHRAEALARRRKSADAYAASKTTAERGYSGDHAKLRAEWAKAIEAGGVRCARCHKPINPGDPFDLGHDDLDRSRYSGAECVPCNRATAKHRADRRKAQPPRRHREPSIAD